MLIIFGTGFAGDLKILATSDSGNKLTKIGSAITYLFGAMAIFAGLIGMIVGFVYTKLPKCSKVCACFVSKEFDRNPMLKSCITRMIDAYYSSIYRIRVSSSLLI